MPKQFSYAYNSKNLTAMGAIQYVRLRPDTQETLDRLTELAKESMLAAKFRGAGHQRIKQFIDSRPEWMRAYLYSAIDRFSRGAIFVDAKQVSPLSELPTLVLKGVGEFYADVMPLRIQRIDHIRIHHGFVFLGYNFGHTSTYEYDYTIWPDDDAGVKYEKWFATKFKGVSNADAAGQRGMVKTSNQFKVGETRHGPHSLIIRGMGSFGLPRELSMEGVKKIMIFANRMPDTVDKVGFKIRVLL